MTADLMNSDFRLFKIEIDKNEYPTHDNMPITGHIKIELKKPLIIKAIKIQFKGRALHRENGNESEKAYVDNDFNLLDRIPGQPVPASFPWNANFLYSLPFNFIFPAMCPTSYESPQGYIRYWLRCTVVLDDAQKTEYMIKKGLNVVAWRATSSADHPSNSISASETISFGTCCCRGKLSAEVQLPKSNYSPGEVVYGSLKINNRHPRHMIELVDVKLVDSLTRANSPFAYPGRTLVHQKLDLNNLKPKGVTQKDDIAFIKIPAVAPTTIQGSSDSMMTGSYINEESNNVGTMHSNSFAFRKQPFLQIHYEIQVVISGKLELRLPITIAALQTQGSRIVYKPFVGGPQNIIERDEMDKKRLNNFEFTPYYPYLNEITSTIGGVGSDGINSSS